MRLANISWSLAGLAVPVLVAALTIPALIDRIGLDRFGMLALAWGLIGFAGALDLGIGRATTLTIAQLRGSAGLVHGASVMRMASSMTLRVSSVVAVLFTVVVVLGGTHFIKYPIPMRPEVDAAAYLVALTIPVQALSATYRGVNEALERFREISLLRIGLGIANFLGPFLLALLTTHLAALVGVLLASRLVALYIYRQSAARHMAASSSEHASIANAAQHDADIRKKMLAFGSWFTVSCIVSPLMTQADRFVIGVLISAQAIAAYTIPLEVVTQALIVTGAVSSVAFPSLSKLMVSNPKEADRVFRLWLLRLAVLMLLITGALAFVLPELLPLWIGNALPQESVTVGQILCIGVFANAIGSMYFASIHAQARADITAKIHLLELPVFLVALYFLTTTYGVIGAAVAWSARMVLDTCLLWQSRRVLVRRTQMRKEGHDA